MARSKKKKWKSRIKKALKLAAIGGATYLAAKRFGGKKATVADTAASEDANIGVTHPALAADAPVVRKAPVDNVVTTPDDSWLDTPRGPHGAGGKGDYWRKQKALAYVNPNEQTLAAGNAYVPRVPRVHNRAVNRGTTFKHGGRVTGIAKRGFGRALMKGKK